MSRVKIILTAVVTSSLVALALIFSPEPTQSAGVADPQTGKSLGVAASFALIVNDVHEGSPAAEANLAPGDFILGVDGKQFFSLNEFQSLVRAPGKPLKLRVLRINDSGQQDVFEVHTRRP
ncbi:MAG TPA: PDZ domain-containing protein [Pyrinomonadaceae bacterium]|nr:PDZ domain-containing protein [Pyrinomonadaceae bacterium]